MKLNLKLEIFFLMSVFNDTKTSVHPHLIFHIKTFFKTMQHNTEHKVSESQVHVRMPHPATSFSVTFTSCKIINCTLILLFQCKETPRDCVKRKIINMQTVQ